MKKFLLSLAIVLAILPAFAATSPSPVFTKEIKFVCAQQFEFIGIPGQENDPTKYVSVAILPDCDGTSKLCALCFDDATLVYTAAEAAAAGHPEWTGKPKVRPSSILANAIGASLAAPSPDPFTFNYASGTKSVIVYEKA